MVWARLDDAQETPLSGAIMADARLRSAWLGRMRYDNLYRDPHRAQRCRPRSPLGVVSSSISYSSAAGSSSSRT